MISNLKLTRKRVIREPGKTARCHLKTDLFLHSKINNVFTPLDRFVRWYCLSKNSCISHDENFNQNVFK